MRYCEVIAVGLFETTDVIGVAIHIRQTEVAGRGMKCVHFVYFYMALYLGAVFRIYLIFLIDKKSTLITDCFQIHQSYRNKFEFFSTNVTAELAALHNL